MDMTIGRSNEVSVGDQDHSVLAAGAWTIDPDHSNVEFVARHLLSKLRGRFRDFGGTIDVAHDLMRSAVAVDIRSASIDTNHGERDEHLRDDDFLGVERFPTLSFHSTSIADIDLGSGRCRLEGDLTIRGVTRGVVLDVEYLGQSDDPWGSRRAGFSARTEIDRDDFGASWNVMLESGGLLVGKKVKVELEIEAVQRAADHGPGLATPTSLTT